MRASKRRFGAALFSFMAICAAAFPGIASTNDPKWGDQWNLHKVGIEQAWGIANGRDVRIAILDTGVDMSHVDLAGHIVFPKDLVDGDDVPQDVYGHGTMVAGIAAALTSNGLGIAGTARDAKFVPVRIANARGEASTDAISAAMEYAVNPPVFAQVINLSFGANSVCPFGVCVPASPEAVVPELDSSISYAFARGALVVVSAGNEGASLCDYPGFSPFALCVGATDSTDHVPGFSNHGLRVDVVAPGVGITSTAYDPRQPTQHALYASGSGTSFSAPLVAGIGALLMGLGATNVEAIHFIECTASDLGPAGYDTTYGWGRVDAARAVKAYAAPPAMRPVGC